jgi:hypothetical protein
MLGSVLSGFPICTEKQTDNAYRKGTCHQMEHLPISGAFVPLWAISISWCGVPEQEAGKWCVWLVPVTTERDHVTNQPEVAILKS